MAAQKRLLEGSNFGESRRDYKLRKSAGAGYSLDPRLRCIRGSLARVPEAKAGPHVIHLLHPGAGSSAIAPTSLADEAIPCRLRDRAGVAKLGAFVDQNPALKACPVTLWCGAPS